MNAAQAQRERRAQQVKQLAKEKTARELHRERVALELGDTVPPEKDSE